MVTRLPVCAPLRDGERVDSGGAMHVSTIQRRTSHRFIPTIPAAFDVADYLDSEEVIAEYLNVALASEHQDLLLQAIANVAKARGMAQLAKDTGLVRESLYKALATGAKPRYACYIMIRPRGGALRQVHNRTRHRWTMSGVFVRIGLSVDGYLASEGTTIDNPEYKG